MKCQDNEIAILYTRIVFPFDGACSRERNGGDNLLLAMAERLVQEDADSAARLPDSISAPDELSDKDFALWCMLQGRAVDKLHTFLPAPYQYRRAAKWYSAYGTPEEQAQILLYISSL